MFFWFVGGFESFGASSGGGQERNTAAMNRQVMSDAGGFRVQVQNERPNRDDRPGFGSRGRGSASGFRRQDNNYPSGNMDRWNHGAGTYFANFSDQGP